MSIEECNMTIEDVQKLGKLWGDAFLASLSPERKLQLVKDISIKQFLEKIPIKQRLKDIPIEQRLEDIPIQKIEAVLKKMKLKKRQSVMAK